MKPKKMVSVLASIVLLCIVSILGIWFQKYSSSEAAAVDGSDKIILSKDSAYALGTENNPFVLLEIVPYEGYAEMGYLVKGQEPVNIDALSWAKDYYGTIDSTHAFTYQKYDWYQTFTPSEGMKNSLDCQTEEAIQYGYYQKVADNTGDYQQRVLLTENGQIKKAEYEKVDSNTGNYKWYGYELGITHSITTPDHNADQVYTTKKSTLYKATGVKATNNNIFLTQCLNLTDTAKIENYKIKVITVTSQQLNNNIDLIDKANLIYITDKSHNNEFTKIWAMDRFRRTDLFSYKDVLSEASWPKFYTPGYDLTWEAVMKILQKKLGTNLPSGVSQCPIVYDVCSLNDIIEKDVKTKEVTIYKKTKDKKMISEKGKANENNVYKLGLMMRQMRTEDLFKLYFDPEHPMIRPGKKDDGMSTGEFWNIDGPSAGTYWNPFILIPYQLINLGSNSGITNEMRSQLNAMGYLTYSGFDGSYNVLARDELFMFNGDNSLEMTFTNPWGVQYNSLTTKEAFEYYGLDSGTLSPAQIIRFLLDNNNLGADIKDLNILEIQPFEDFKTDTQWKEFIKKKLPGFDGSLIVDAMTTKEFICHIEELVGTYDLIYIGMNHSASAKDKYKYDLSKPDFYYSHVGQLVNVENKLGNMSNWIIGKSGNFDTRFAGNDITKLKMEAILEYVNSGYPIMLGSGMLLETDISSKPDSLVIDQSSYIYQLVDTIKSNTTTMKEDSVTPKQFYNLIKRVICNVDFSVLPKPYKDTITVENKATLTPQDNFINGSNNSNRYLDYEFTISDDGSGSYYKASLYVDSNADGLFQEGIGEEEIAVGDVIEDNSRIVASNQLSAGHHYKIHKKIDQYSGVITWKFSVERLKKNADGTFQLTGIKQIKIGVSAINKSPTMPKETIKVLQIASYRGKTPGSIPSIYLPTSTEIKNSGAANLDSVTDIISAFQNNIIPSETGGYIDDRLARISGLFYYYIKNLADYDISFERLTAVEYSNRIQNDTIDLDDYQMLIIGFADLNTDIDYEPAREEIEKFIAKGKTVLFTHDTTYHQTTNKMTLEFRDRLGMDRFGTMLMRTDSSITNEKLAEKKKDFSFVPDTAQLTSPLERTRSYGFTNQQLRRYTTDRTTPGLQIDFTNLITDTVTNINQGQITRYPYMISNNLTVADTHYQYFQLNMEDPEIVVWYSLKKDGVYDINDGRNAYYIYNKGNITYSGAGHISNPIGDWEMNAEEVKLFINTMIAAYRATPIPIEIQITNTDKTTDNNKDFLLVDYDSDNAVNAMGNDVNSTTQTKRIFFKLANNTTYTGGELVIAYATSNASFSESTLSVVTKKKVDNSEVNNNEIVCDTEYYIDVPLDKLMQNNSLDVIFNVTLKYETEEGLNLELKSTRNVQLIRRGLFNLD